MKVPVVVSELIDELRFLGFTVITWGRRSGFVVIWRRGSQRWSIAAVHNNNARLNMTIEMLRKEMRDAKDDPKKKTEDQLDMMQYVTNLLYAAKEKHSVIGDEFDKWVESEVENLAGYVNYRSKEV